MSRSFRSFHWVLVVSFLLFAAATASADTFALTSCADGTGGSVSGTSAVSAPTCSGTINTAQAIGSSSASSSADYGVLKVFGNASSDAGTGIATQAQAKFNDSLTFSGFTGTAFLQLTQELSGTLTQTVSGTGVTGSSYVLQSSLSSGGFGGNECALADVTGQCTVTLAISAGDTVTLQMLLGLSLNALGSSASITGDFSHTGKVDSLLVVDSNGHAINGAQILSASGTSYPTGAVAAVPEPGTLGLFGGGLAAISGFLRRKLRG